MTDVLNSHEQVELVRTLAAGVTTQAAVSNRTWFALVTVAVIALLPVPEQAIGKNHVLPFSLGEATPGTFFLAAFALLFVLTIAFCSAHAQQVRAQQLAQRELQRILRDHPRIAGMHPRDLFDFMREPSVNRVAPLAQLMRGRRHQFYDSSTPCPRWRTFASVLSYAVLKVFSWFVYFGVPALALCTAYSHLRGENIKAAATVGLLVAGLSWLYVALNDLFYSVQVVVELYRQGQPAAK